MLPSAPSRGHGNNLAREAISAYKRPGNGAWALGEGRPIPLVPSLSHPIVPHVWQGVKLMILVVYTSWILLKNPDV